MSHFNQDHFKLAGSAYSSSAAATRAREAVARARAHLRTELPHERPVPVAAEGRATEGAFVTAVTAAGTRRKHRRAVTPMAERRTEAPGLPNTLPVSLAGLLLQAREARRTVGDVLRHPARLVGMVRRTRADLADLRRVARETWREIARGLTSTQTPRRT